MSLIASTANSVVLAATETADAGYAALSNNLLLITILTYAAAMTGYTVEYAFGHRGYIARNANRSQESAQLSVREPVGVMAGAIAGSDSKPISKTQAFAKADEDTADSTDAVTPVSPNDGSGNRATRAVILGRFAVAATVLGAVTHAGSLFTRGLAAQRVPWGNMYEFILAACFVGVVAWLILVALRPMRHLGIFVLLPVVLLLGLAGTVLYTDAGPLVPALNSAWLKIHVSTAAISSGIFMVGFVAAALFLIRHRFETLSDKEKPLRFPFTLGPRLPESDTLERLTFRIHALAFPLWTFAVIAGAIWAESAWTRYWSWDPKETWAFISWVVYAAYLHARATAGWRGNRAVAIAVVGWATMMVNLFVINLVQSGLHSYAGI